MVEEQRPSSRSAGGPGGAAGAGQTLGLVYLCNYLGASLALGVRVLING